MLLGVAAPHDPSVELAAVSDDLALRLAARKETGGELLGAKRHPYSQVPPYERCTDYRRGGSANIIGFPYFCLVNKADLVIREVRLDAILQGCKVPCYTFRP